MNEDAAISYSIIGLMLIGLLMLGVGGGLYVGMGIVSKGCEPVLAGPQPECVSDVATLSKLTGYALKIGAIGMILGGWFGYYHNKESDGENQEVEA